MLFGPGFEIGDVDVALRVGLDDHDLHSRHDGAGRVGAVRRLRNQTGGAMRLAAVLVIGTDHQQPRKLPLRSGIRLQRHLREPGDLGQPFLELAEQRGIPLGLRARGERVQAVEAAPGDGNHLGRRVELHRRGPRAASNTAASPSRSDAW